LQRQNDEIVIDFSQNDKITTITAVISQTQTENRHVNATTHRPEHPNH
jgi:uncharacterized protein YuzE